MFIYHFFLLLYKLSTNVLGVFRELDDVLMYFSIKNLLISNTHWNASSSKFNISYSNHKVEYIFYQYSHKDIREAEKMQFLNFTFQFKQNWRYFKTFFKNDFIEKKSQSHPTNTDGHYCQFTDDVWQRNKMQLIITSTNVLKLPI